MSYLMYIVLEDLFLELEFMTSCFMRHDQYLKKFRAVQINGMMDALNKFI